jgi:hypothetical protein
MDGAATLTTKKSNSAMNVADRITGSIIQRRGAGVEAS